MILLPLSAFAFAQGVQGMGGGEVPIYLGPRAKTGAAIFLVCVLGLQFGLNVKAAFTPPRFNQQKMQYYAALLEENTPLGARIATEPGLIGFVGDGRQVLNLAPLVWERWRGVYPYEKIVEILNPDTIALSPRHYEWSHQDHPQTKAFLRLLEEEYILKAKINHSDYGAFLIYTRRAGDEKSIQPLSTGGEQTVKTLRVVEYRANRKRGGESVSRGRVRVPGLLRKVQSPLIL